MRCLGVSIRSGGSKGLSRRRTKGFLPLRGCESQLKCSWRTKVRRNKQVGWPSPSEVVVFWTLGEEKPSLFPLRLEAGAGSPGVEQIPYGVVSQGAFATSTTSCCVVGKSVKDTIAFWAPFIAGGVSHPKAVPEFSTESCRFHLRAATWDSSQEGSCPGFCF